MLRVTVLFSSFICTISVILMVPYRRLVPQGAIE